MIISPILTSLMVTSISIDNFLDRLGSLLSGGGRMACFMGANIVTDPYAFERDASSSV